MNTIVLKDFLRVALCSACLLLANNASSQENKLKIKPTSRLLVDGATFSDKNVDLTDGVAIRDFRMGLKAYYDAFYLKADVSFAGNKVNLKDIYLQYNLSDKALIRAGHFSMPFGLQSAYGTAHKQFMAEPSSNVFQVGRRVGIMHSLWNDQFWLSYGAFADIKSITESTDKSGKQGYTISERFVYKPFCTDQTLLQVGLSLAHTQAEAQGKGEPNYFNYKTSYLSAVDKTNAVDAVIDKARYENKATFEFAGIYKNFALESQYYYTHINRQDDSPSFNGSGFYAVARSIIFNKADYGYSQASAGISNPSDKALELAFGYSMVDLNSKKTEIYGGKMDDISLGLAFYWNKYVTVRTNYSYITVKNREEDPKKRVNAFQCRVQYYF